MKGWIFIYLVSYLLRTEPPCRWMDFDIRFNDLLVERSGIFGCSQEYRIDFNQNKCHIIPILSRVFA